MIAPNMSGLRCACGGELGQVVDSRPVTGYVRRRRVCGGCGERTTTHERVIVEDPNAELGADVFEIALRARRFAAEVLELTVALPGDRVPARSVTPEPVPSSFRRRSAIARRFAPVISAVLRGFNGEEAQS